MPECLRCNATYTPKRKGGKYCSTNCRVYYNAQLKRVPVFEKEVVTEQIRVSRLLFEVVALAKLTQRAVQGRQVQEDELVPEAVNVFLNYCAGLRNATLEERAEARELLTRQADQGGRAEEQKPN